MNNDNDKKALLHESLSFLVESATINGGTLSVSEINEAIKDIVEDKSMYELVYNYLLENKINIEGYEKNVSIVSSATTANADESADISDINDDMTSEDDKEKNILNMYYSELDSIKKLSEEEELKLLEKFLSDSSDKEALSELTTANLPIVILLHQEYKNKGVTSGDLIQEGNLGLLEGILSYDGLLNLEEFHSHLENVINNAFNDVILEQNSSSRISSHAADRANEIDRASIELSKKLDRTPTLTELSEFLSLPEDEVERVMKMSLNALTIDNSDIEG